MASECHVCEKEATFYCSVCKGVRYCCKKHQELDWASHKKMCKILKLIMPVINEGGDPNACIKGVQPLILACEYGLDDVARQLIEKGARVGEQSRNGDTALFLACIKGHDRCVRVLIEHGVDVNVPNKNQSFPLMMASHEGHAQTVAALLEGGPRSPAAMLNVKDMVGSRALHYAAVKGRTHVAQLLLDAGAEIDLQSADGYTALMRATYCGHEDCAMLLIERGSNENSRDTNGATALICACGKGFSSLAMKLLDHGADPLITAGDGSTPLMLAGENRLTNVQDRLVALSTAQIDPASEAWVMD
jgi:ankyrin repeat protein